MILLKILFFPLYILFWLLRAVFEMLPDIWIGISLVAILLLIGALAFVLLGVDVVALISQILAGQGI